MAITTHFLEFVEFQKYLPKASFVDISQFLLQQAAVRSSSSSSCLNGTRSHLKIAKNDPISLGGIACVDAISDALIVNLAISRKILVVLFSCRCAMQY